MQPQVNFLKINYISFKTIVFNEIYRFMRIWQQTLLPSTITISLYFIIFGAFIGNQIGKIEGVSYMQFITPGLIMMTVINNAYTNVVFSFYSIRFQRSIEELLSAPVPAWLILIGYTTGGVVRGILNGICVTIVALFFTHLKIQHPLIIIAIVLLTSILFALAGFTNGILARNFDDTAIVPTFILTPLTYLGGIFYSITQLPPAWQIVSKFNPILYMVNGFRYGLLGISDVPIALALILLMIAIGGLFILNLILLRKGTGVRS